MLDPSPKGAMPERRLKPKTQGSERTTRAMQSIRQDLFFDQPKRSLVQEIIFSNTAKTVDIAAKVIKTKKSEPQSLPRGILLKTFGRVWKMRAGPALTSVP